MIVDPPSLIVRHMKWKMAHTKQYGQMASTATPQISDKIVSLCYALISIQIFAMKTWSKLKCKSFLWLLQDSLQEQITQGNFIPDGRDDILNTAIGRPEHPGRIRVARTSVTINFGQALCGSNTSSASITPQQLVEINENLKEWWKRKTNAIWR